MNDHWYHLVPDAVLLRMFGQRPELRCLCCGVRYRRGFFTCCAPPTGMRSDRWLELTCPMPDQGGCGKCPRHCQCASKHARLSDGPLASLARHFLADAESRRIKP